MNRVLLSVMVAWLMAIAPSLLAQDTTPPVIFCPGNMSENLAPGECEAQVSFSIFATDNQSTPTVTQLDGTGLSSGDIFPIGTTTLSFMAQDTSGNADTCSFDITVVEYVPATPALVCDDFLNISLPAAGCAMYLTPGILLEGFYGCYDDYVVTVNNTNSSYINYANVGQTITFHVTDPQSGNTCWGLALIEDKSGPYIQGCGPVTVNCLADLRPTSEGGDVPTPTFSDCTTFTVIYMDMVTPGTCSDPYSEIIMRMWTATDANGRSSNCSQIITVERLNLLDLSPSCPADATVECQIGVTPDLSPEALGFPFDTINGVVYEITDAPGLCNIASTYTDLILPKCGIGYHLVRKWSVYDWCRPIDGVTNPWTCTQVISYVDHTAPVITPPANMTANANLAGCRARPILPPVSVSDCSGYTVSMTTPFGIVNSNGGQVPAPGLPIGTHIITVKATDACGNSSTVTFTVTVVDNVKPTPICDSHTTVALDGQGFASVNSTVFDDGSTDNCCIQDFQVRRMTDNCGVPANLVLGNTVQFCCSDVGQPVMVLLRVNDCNGNYNECMVEVTVQDKTNPSITCPPNITLFCGANYNDLNLTGEVVTNPALQGPNDGFAFDNCTNVVVTHTGTGTVSCGDGVIYRTWKATDVAGVMATCLQTITVQNNSPFVGSSIVWPADVTINGCNAATDPAVAGEPILPPSNACYTLVLTHEDQIFTSVPDACRKILRRWIVLDWCQYNPNVPNSPGRYEHVQTIKITDNIAPLFANCDNRTFCNFKPDCSDLAPNLTVSATDDCTAALQLHYSWTVDLHNDGVADAGYVTSGTGQNTTQNYPIGTHRIQYSVSDGCGNTGFCNFLFSIEDCKKPTPICVNGLVVEMMAGGSVPLNVAALESGFSNDNCTDYQDLIFSYSPLTSDKTRNFTCADLGQVPVQIWATDENGNQDFCETFVIIQDNMNACPGNLVALQGQVATEEQEGVENVMVELSGNGNTMAYTNGLGAYQFPALAAGGDYDLAPQFDENPLNGVTTFDLLLLHRHVLGISLLDSPYKLIAGDINHSGSLTIGDVVELRKVVLHILPTFPNNTSWRFVDGHYVFPNLQNPFSPAFPESCSINNLAAGSPSPNFVAVKIGDLNGTASVNLLGQNEDRTSGADFVMQTADKKVKTGETVTVELAGNLEDVLGYQFTLNFDNQALSVEKITPGELASDSNFGTTLAKEGAVTASWNQLIPVKTSGIEHLFSLTFKAKKDGQLSELLSINSRFTKAESYMGDGSSGSVALHFDNGQSENGDAFQLFQNIPNPFGDATVIRFQLPESTQAALTIFDVSGKKVKEIKGDFSKGSHEIKLEKGELPNRGIYYYRLETPGNTATMKMTVF